MREIKFRAWDKDSNKMITSDELQAQVWNIYGSMRSPEHSSWTYMQYTGLKDKNGKEIYVGDVVRDVYRYSPEMSFDEYDREETFLIESLATVFFRHLPGHNFFRSLDDLVSYYGSSSGKYGLEVIGNIYENPELLQRQE